MVGVNLCSSARRFDRREQRVDIGDEKVGGAHQLHGEAGVEHVGRRHALMHEARVRPDEFGEMREEGDDVVLGHALDLVDAGDVERDVSGLVPDRLRRSSFGMTPSSAIASQAWASISNQMRKRVCGSQMSAIFAGIAGDHLQARRLDLQKRGPIMREAARPYAQGSRQRKRFDFSAGVL